MAYVTCHRDHSSHTFCWSRAGQLSRVVYIPAEWLRLLPVQINGALRITYTSDSQYHIGVSYGRLSILISWLKRRFDFEAIQDNFCYITFNFHLFFIRSPVGTRPRCSVSILPCPVRQSYSADLCLSSQSCCHIIRYNFGLMIRWPKFAFRPLPQKTRWSGRE